ncbi:unnamed protein product [Prorocentrum cordatum]|uniref:Uncharacterized protein n=1 Tax=Prorocentrum cordatum TaxID=2364126 RepID=A0ABN9T3B6_9DINO|nr:unnamed protein product [Polarella glacialis]
MKDGPLPQAPMDGMPTPPLVLAPASDLKLGPVEVMPSPRSELNLPVFDMPQIQGSLPPPLSDSPSITPRSARSSGKAGFEIPTEEEAWAEMERKLAGDDAEGWLDELACFLEEDLAAEAPEDVRVATLVELQRRRRQFEPAAKLDSARDSKPPSSAPTSLGDTRARTFESSARRRRRRSRHWAMPARRKARLIVTRARPARCHILRVRHGTSRIRMRPGSATPASRARVGVPPARPARQQILRTAWCGASSPPDAG